MRRLCRACGVSLPCTCFSTTPSAGQTGLRTGWLISRLPQRYFSLMALKTRWAQKIIFSFLHFLSQGGILMPLFFLISGFSLARSYGPRMSIHESNFEPKEDKLWLHLRGYLLDILNLRTHKYSPLRFVAITVATQRIPIQIFLQSSIR